MANLEGCQMPCLPHMAEGQAIIAPQPLIRRLKRSLAVPWNYHVKKWLKGLYHFLAEHRAVDRTQPSPRDYATKAAFHAGDWVRVRSETEIASTLDPFRELRGCAFLEGMSQYCDTRQRVFKVMERFLDERDYRVKKVRGVILLENVICEGTPAFGECDRSCFLFWREEWLERAS